MVVNLGPKGYGPLAPTSRFGSITPAICEYFRRLCTARRSFGQIYVRHISFWVLSSFPNDSKF
jgi:hypothetical protein